jgi:hypothetical protein
MYCQFHSPQSILDAYNVAFHLLPNLAWLGLSIADCQHSLLKAGVVVRNAVSAAIDAGQCETAVEWMDQGQSVIWSQLLQLRMPVDDLKRFYPDIADRFMTLSKKLEGSGTDHNFVVVSSDGMQQSTATVPERYHELADERTKLMKHIRGLDGFDRFLLPQKLSQLQIAACNGLVIFINVSKSHSDVLILMPNLDNVLHISLEKFTYNTAEALYKCLRLLVQSPGHCILHDTDFEVRVAPSDVHLDDLGMKTAFECILSRMSPLRDEDRETKLVPTFGSLKNPKVIFQRILAVL